MQDLAVYITTTRSNYYLCKALIASLEQFARRPAIYILPEDSYAKDAMFGYPVWRPQDPRVLALNYYYTKLRIFWGPAERFLYLDADVLALKDLLPLTEFIEAHKAPFVAVYDVADHVKLWRDAGQAVRDEIHTRWVGDVDKIRRFDPGYVFPEIMPFETGFFCASRDAVNHEAFLDTFERAARFNSSKGEVSALTRPRKALFNQADMGFLNYFLSSQKIGAERLEDAVLWGGNRSRFERRDQLQGPLTGLFCHWSGCARPGPWPIRLARVPGQREWRKQYIAFCKSRNDWRGGGKDLVEDLARCARQRCSSAKQFVARRLGRRNSAAASSGPEKTA